ALSLFPLDVEPVVRIASRPWTPTGPDRTRRNGMARRTPPRKVTYFAPVLPRLARNTHHRIDVRSRPPLPLHDARRLRPARSRRGDPAGAGRMAPAYARAPRRRRA